MGRNPKTGELVDVKPKKLPFFKSGLDIKNRTKIRNVFEYIGSQTRTNLIYVSNPDEETLNCMTHMLNMDGGKAMGTLTL